MRVEIIFFTINLEEANEIKGEFPSAGSNFLKFDGSYSTIWRYRISKRVACTKFSNRTRSLRR